MDRQKPPHFPFFHLPRELRDQIYREALLASAPIIVWSGELRLWTRTPNCAEEQVECEYIVDRSRTKESLQGLSLHIFSLNRTVLEEATAIFYCENAFEFEGDHNWDPIATWLTAIGTANCRHITRLVIHAQGPATVAQKCDGMREKLLITFPELYERSVLLSLPTARCGAVENINHEAIDTMFELLSNVQQPEGLEPIRKKIHLGFKMTPYYGTENTSCGILSTTLIAYSRKVG